MGGIPTKKKKTFMDGGAQGFGSRIIEPEDFCALSYVVWIISLAEQGQD